jgi:hypothetical protein
VCDARNIVSDSLQTSPDTVDSAIDDYELTNRNHADIPIVLQLPDSFDIEKIRSSKHCSMCGNRGHNKNTCQDKSISVVMQSKSMSKLLTDIADNCENLTDELVSSFRSPTYTSVK